MSNLTTKQKIILGVIVCGMIIVIGIYGYVSLNKDGEELDISEMSNSEEINGIDTENSQNAEGKINSLGENNQDYRRRRRYNQRI